MDVEAAEAVIAEASFEPVLEGDSEEEEEQEGGQPGPSACPSSGARSTIGSDPESVSGGSTPCASSGCSSPRSGLDVASLPPASPKQVTAAAGRLAGAAQPQAAPLPVPGSAAAEEPAACRSGSGLSASLSSPPLGSLGSICSRRSSLGMEGKPSFRAVAANWRAWVSVRDSPCPGHPMRYSEEQIEYHYTRNRMVLAKALLRRNLVSSRCCRNTHTHRCPNWAQASTAPLHAACAAMRASACTTPSLAAGPQHPGAAGQRAAGSGAAVVPRRHPSGSEGGGAPRLLGSGARPRGAPSSRNHRALSRAAGAPST